MSNSSPPAPDYTGAAQATGQASQQAIEQQNWANRPTVNTPFGQQSWQITPTWDPTTNQYINQWTQNTKLTDPAQNALDSQLQIQQGRSDIANDILPDVGQQLSTPLDYSGATPLADTPQGQQISGSPVQGQLDYSGVSGLQDPNDIRSQVMDASYKQQASRLDPRFSQGEEALKSQLYNQGLREGDKAWDTAFGNFNMNKNDAYTSAANSAITNSDQAALNQFNMGLGTRQQGVSEVNQQGEFANSANAQGFNQNAAASQQNFAQDTASANYQNTLRQQQIAEMLQKRGSSLNDVNALLNGQQVTMPGAPSFNTSGVSAAPNYLGAAGQQYNAASNTASVNNANTNSTISGLLSMMYSDRRLKRNIQRLFTVGNIPWYTYEYIWGQRGVGVMADEVSHLPGVVSLDANGFAMVNYGALYG